MANPDHLAIIKKGVEHWNAWRRTALGTVAGDLRGAILDGTDLSGANLSGTDLEVASLLAVDFRRSNLSRANLKKTTFDSRTTFCDADLTDAQLTNANMSGVGFGRSDFSGATLVRADLSYAEFSGARFHRANLEGATFKGSFLVWTDFSRAVLIETDFSLAHLLRNDFSNAIMQRTTFGSCTLADGLFIGVDLSSLLGLETVHHSGPSTISIDTIYRSKGRIPDAFMRGVGIPDAFVAQVPTLVGQSTPTQFHSCFLSHSASDSEFSIRLHADLKAHGVRCWMSEEHLKAGERFRDEIEASIQTFDKVLVVLSASSIRSAWVRDEVEAAMEKERRLRSTVLVPIMIDDEPEATTVSWAAAIRRVRQIGDFRKWRDTEHYQLVLQKLLRDLVATRSQ